MMKQILFSGVIGLFLTLVGTPLLIKLLARKGYGQFIRDDGPREPRTASAARPTMGGIAFILATLVAYALTKVITGEPARRFSGRAGALPDGGHGPGRLPRRLHQDRQAALAGSAGQGEDGRPADRRHRLRGARRCSSPTPAATTPASTKLSFITDFGWSIGPVLFVDLGAVHDPRDVERREPDGRSGRPGHRRLGDGLRRVHLHRRLAVPGVLRQRA